MNRRVFVKKKEGFTVESESLLQELKENLNELGISKLDIFNIYDIFNIEEGDLQLLKESILSEVVTDETFEEIDLSCSKFLAIEFLPGQYDQRSDSAIQCLTLLEIGGDIRIKSGRLLVFHGEVKSLENIKKYLINPIESREKNLSVLVDENFSEVKPVNIITGFINFLEEELMKFSTDNSLTLTLADLFHIQNYFKNSEKRDPTETEIKVLDTYWSDHCRHSTFETYLESIRVKDGILKEKIDLSLKKYLSLKDKITKDKPVTLMDMATLPAKYLKSIGKLEDLEDSKENNACSIEVDIDVDGKMERYLLMFKNETHNHPTEIEPFGGASTCIGGAIRDPLSGRAYVYQAMRITGAGDIRKDVQDTLPNKLPQKIISKSAASGYSSYGNQIGLATTYVRELFHPGYEAKRMEVGAVVGAVKKSDIIREEPIPGDLVILIGGRTGRDGIGGATGSSKKHDNTSLESCSSEVQKGNAPQERKIQRLFRNPEVTKIIKKSNDFGAGGISVAIGEIADGVLIDLDMVPTKYHGLSGTELAISESQERMAVVIAPCNKDIFFRFLESENLEGAIVATVTSNRRVVMRYQERVIVNISRDFLNTNGVRGRQSVIINSNFPKIETLRFSKENFISMLTSLNVSTQKGMMEIFDYSIGRGTVLLPYGGSKQLTQSEASVQKIAVDGITDSCSILSYGFNPNLSKRSPYLGGAYAVIESLCKIVAVGGDYKKARLSFQEYFEKLGKNQEKWGKPASALLGAIEAQLEFETPAIGGKDSMSGSFNTVHVPPTLISFAVAVENVKNIIGKEFNRNSKYVYLFEHNENSDGTPNYTQLKNNFQLIRENILNENIVSAGVVSFGGWGEAIAKMSIGSMKFGGEFNSPVNPLKMQLGSIVVSSRKRIPNAMLLGEIKTSQYLKINNYSFSLTEIKESLEKTLGKIYPIYTEAKSEIDSSILKIQNLPLGEASSFAYRKADKLYDKPKVLIVVFPGTNSEYDTEKAFKKAGAETEIFVFNNLSVKHIDDSINILAKKISNSQIFMIPGGFSAGDEPDGSGKFIATILRNRVIDSAIKELLKNQGLVLGICNGFQALVKSGLLPYGDSDKMTSESPTLFRNDINRHMSQMINTKVTSNSSPWLSSFKVGDIHKLPISHGEGKFIISEELYLDLLKNNQIATRYCSDRGVISMDKEITPNGSMYAVEGVISPCGQIFGKMAHSERYEDGIFKNIDGEKLQDIFSNGVNFFKK